MGGRGSEVQILSPRPLPPDIGGSPIAASVFVSAPIGLSDRAHVGRGDLRDMIPLLYSFASRLARRLPAALAYALARAVGRAFWHARAPRREAVLANLARVVPTLPPRERETLARRLFANFAEALVDSWRAERAGAGHAPTVEIEGDQGLRAAARSGGGARGRWGRRASSCGRGGGAAAGPSAPRAGSGARARSASPRALWHATPAPPPPRGAGSTAGGTSRSRRARDDARARLVPRCTR